MLNAGFALLAMVLAATPVVQATPSAGDAHEIPPVVWELVEISGASDRPVTIAEPERYTVQFAPDGELAVGADCNQAAGTYTTEDGVLDITLTVSTLALCPPESHGEPFLALLDGAIAYELDPDGFLVLAGETGSLRLRASLTGVLWEWHVFRGGDDSLVEPERPEDYTLTFLPDGELAIQSDCNQATGTYSADGPALELSVGSVSRVTCPPGSLADQYLRDLGDVTSHVFRDGDLYLALWADAGIMEFAARYIKPPAATPQAG